MLSQSESDQHSAPSYRALEDHFRRLNGLEEALELLAWDRSVMMPRGGSATRATTTATLAAFHHDLLTDRRVGDWLDSAAESTHALSPWQAANVREMRRQYTHAMALPKDLVEALSLAASHCERVWREARPQADFQAVKANLDALLGLLRQAAQAKADALGVGPYDALLDEYDPGGRSADIDPLFDDLEDFLSAFLPQVLDAQGAPPARPVGPFPLDHQEQVCRQLMQALGFDFDFGRLDVSAHPFCGGSPTDVRITTRYDDSDYSKALMGVLHETGHGLYERGLPSAWAGQPVGKARGMSLHESQSLLVEMQVCRSRAFMTFAAPILRRAFAGSGPLWDAENLYRQAIRVDRTFIRVDADEVTYPLHVIVRYRLEKALIEGRLEAADLPDAWNSLFEQVLGVPVPHDGVGCLQDIHWFDGSWGYFPTYTLGALTAAQIFATAVDADPDIPQQVAQGNVAPLLGWLHRNVHSQASFLSTNDLITHATGCPLSTDAFKAHLKRRYLPD